MTLPLFDRLSPDYQKSYEDFFALTDSANIQSHMRELSLIVDMAEKVEHVLDRANPIWDTWNNQWGDQNRGREARQWHLNNLSQVKRRLAQAIVCKKDYYETTWMGKITKFALKLFCLWNNGNTAAIRKAENFLLRYDSRYPVHQSSDGLYQSNLFWPLMPHSAIQATYNLDNFYNYDAPHAIEVHGGNNETMPRFMVAVN